MFDLPSLCSEQFRGPDICMHMAWDSKSLILIVSITFAITGHGKGIHGAATRQLGNRDFSGPHGTCSGQMLQQATP